jgi:hypothetical protein
VVEGTPLLREHTGQNLYPGFESLRLRQNSQHKMLISDMPSYCRRGHVGSVTCHAERREQAPEVFAVAMPDATI